MLLPVLTLQVRDALPLCVQVFTCTDRNPCAGWRGQRHENGIKKRRQDLHKRRDISQDAPAIDVPSR